MRYLSPDMDLAVVARIDERLALIGPQEAVHVPLAIESGSRAWGFPSPDSDYDCRFVYVRRKRDYLALYPKRDVIELPMTSELDINGWDLAKALRLVLKGNAVIIEWLTSPITYLETAGFRADMLALCHQVADRKRIGSHYLHLAYSMRDRVFQNSESAPLKKAFYVLRPIMAMRWLRLHQTASVAPMSFLTLCAQSELAGEEQARINDLIALKAQTSELGSGVIPVALKNLVLTEIELGEREFARLQPLPKENVEIADRFFLTAVDRYAPKN